MNKIDEKISKTAHDMNNKCDSFLATQTMLKDFADFALSHQWRSVDEELPDDDYDVVVAFEECCGGMSISVANCEDGFWYSSDDLVCEYRDAIKYWMPIPPLPGGEKGERK